MSSPGRATTASHGQAIDDSVKHLHLIDAMRTNDAQTIINAVGRVPPPTENTPTPSYGSPLHLAITLCSTPAIEQLVSSFPERVPYWINARNTPDGETPLHIASKLGRADIVEVVFKVKGIDDTLRDAEGRTAEEVAKSERIAQLVVAHRTEYADKIISAVRQHLNTGSSQAAMDIFKDDARANAYLSMGWIDINAPVDSETEHSFLHFAAKADDVGLVNWALARGADPGVKDRKGKKPAELCPKKDSKTKDKLKTAIAQAPIMSGSLPQATSSITGTAHPSAAPSLRGTLFKWTNYAVGYKSRFFVLEHGNLSYYKSSMDYPLACRGSISTMIASVVLPDSNDKSRFDVIGKGSVRYSLKARSPADAKKWVWALMESKKFMIDRAKESGATSSRISYEGPGGSEEWEGDSDGEPKVESAPLSAGSGNGDTKYLGLPGQEGNTYSARTSLSHDSERASVGAHGSPVVDVLPSTSTEDFGTLVYLLNVQLDVQQRVVEALVDALKSQGPVAAADSPMADTGSLLKDVDVSNLPSLLQSSFKHVQETIRKVVQGSENRERYWSRKWRKERDSRRRWEDVVQKVLGVENANSHEIGTGPLLSVPTTAMGSDAASIATSGADAESDEEDYGEDGEVFYDAVETDGGGKSSSTYIEEVFGFDSMDRPAENEDAQRKASLSRPSRTHTSASLVPAGSGYLLASTELQKSLYGYPGAGTYRTALPIDPSKPKPSLAVWSFLKSAIGKDLSKVTLPVFFNEPLSMLQRMGEDVEYVELLSIASSVGRGSTASGVTSNVASKSAQDLGVDAKALSGLQGEDASLVRLMYVAAYAMSNYSSTVGRVNKPFNPMLGETYELVREDKGYRYLSEQVCHHPPISACYCESPDYTFWTEVNVKSKFWGKSLEIHPLGICHVRLPVYDPSTSTIKETEHYTWKKVTTNVNNLIVGKLWIDHFGDMVVRNWRTGEECILTFKPKNSGGGWFGLGGGSKKKDNGEDADNGGGEISGVVKDRNGVVRWELRGRWDGEVVGIPAGTGKVGIETPLRLWKRNPPPANAAQNFNFTAFAASLNESTDKLEAILPPTDSRLRPDQQAMERGEWDLANSQKEKLEALQRERRKEIVARFEQTGQPSGPPIPIEERGIEIGEKWWVPRWFVREIDEDSGEEHWRFTGEYWKKRSGVVTGGEKWPEWVLDVFGVRIGKV